MNHKLSPTYVEYVKESRAKQVELRKNYLTALGQVKEIELLLEYVQMGAMQQVQLLVRENNLPESPNGYRFSDDGTMLVPVQETQETAQPTGQPLNGAVVGEDHASHQN